ncbi:MAG: hypothetical protein FWD88_03750 [Treponema sp.]|nr:hypothetical protein [Treponema sp.]
MAVSVKTRAMVPVLVALLAATPAFADARLQGTWLMDGPDHTGIIFSGPNFVIFSDIEYFHVVGNFTVSGNAMTLNITLIYDVDEDLWMPMLDTERFDFSFRSNNVLVIDGDVFRRI